MGSVPEAWDSGYVAECKESEQEPFRNSLLGRPSTSILNSLLASFHMVLMSWPSTLYPESPGQGKPMEGCLSSLLGWNVYCPAEFEFLGQLGCGLLLPEGGVASFFGF